MTTSFPGRGYVNSNHTAAINHASSCNQRRTKWFKLCCQLGAELQLSLGLHYLGGLAFEDTAGFRLVLDLGIHLDQVDDESGLISGLLNTDSTQVACGG